MDNNISDTIVLTILNEITHLNAITHKRPEAIKAIVDLVTKLVDFHSTQQQSGAHNQALTQKISDLEGKVNRLMSMTRFDKEKEL